jgi:lysophospholipase L1-like esterase
LAAVEVPFGESYFGRLRARARGGIAMKNFGVSSYSPLLYRLQWEHQVAAFRPTHVVLMFCGNDVRNDEEYAQAATYDADGRIVAVPDRGASALVRHLRRLYIARMLRRFEQIVRFRLRASREDLQHVTGGFVEENPPIATLTSEAALDLVSAIQATGAEVVMCVVPSRYRLQHREESFDRPEYADYWREWTTTHGVNYLDLKPDFERSADAGSFPFFQQDVHFNAVGHSVVADRIASAMPGLFE